MGAKSMLRQVSESASPIARLRGMSDLTGPPLRDRDALQRRLAALMDSHGYQPLDTPLMEPTELFLRKSGGELASQLFSFTDPAGQAVSLRPEFTAPAIRHYLEDPSGIELPARWQYCGPVFRFDPPISQDGGHSRSQFLQAGAELLGSSDVLSDVELLSLAIGALEEAGIEGWTLRLADLSVLNSLLEPLGLSERARAFVVENVPRLQGGPSVVEQLMDESRRLHVVGRLSEDDHLSQAVQGLDDDEARSVLLGVLRSNPLDQLGQRRPEEVVERLLRKIRRPDAEESLRLALQSASELAGIHGDAPSALQGAAASLRRAGADASAIDRLRQVLGMVPGRGRAEGEIVLDFGLVRGLAYYNGIVFEVSHPRWPAPLGGGGRYDGLARDLGGSARLPALGFAYNLDALTELSDNNDPRENSTPERVWVIAKSPAAHTAALDSARSLRNQGQIAILEVTGRSAEEASLCGARLGFSKIAVVDQDGRVSIQTL